MSSVGLPRSHFPRLTRPLSLCLLGLAAAWPLCSRALNPRVPASDYNLRGWQTEDGLPSGKVREVAQTPDGYLWIATALGLARFDGVNFALFDPSTRPDLSSNNFNCITRARDGSLWFGTNTGLYRYANDRFEHFDMKSGLPHNYVRFIRQRRDGRLVVGTGKGFAIVADGKIVAAPPAWTPAQENVRSYIERADGSQYLGTESGLWRAVGDKVEKLSGSSGLPDTGYLAFLEGADGELWLGTLAGAWRLDAAGRVEPAGSDPNLMKARVHCMTRDRQGNIWFGTYAGLFRYSQGRSEAAPYPDGFGISSITHLHEDSEGALWVGSNLGLYRLSDSAFSAIDHRHGLDRAGVFELAETRDGAWWFGVWGGGVFRKPPGEPAQRIAGIPPGLQLFYAIHEASDGSVWIASNANLFRVENGRVTSYLRSAPRSREDAAPSAVQILDGVIHPRINDIVSDGAGGLWLAPNGPGLYHYRDGRFEYHTPETGVPIGAARDLVWSREGDLWAAFPGQSKVARLRQGEWTTYPLPLSGDHAPAMLRLFEDSVGALWVGTDRDGLMRLVDGKWRAYTTKDGLTHNTVAGIAEDDLGFLWVGTPHGLMRVARSEFEAYDAGKTVRLTTRLFNRNDGMTVSETNPLSSPGMIKTRDGRLLVATEVGAAVVDPKAVTANPLPPPVHIERLMVERRPLPPTARRSLPAGSREVEISYTGISLLAPEKVRFRVQLFPLDAGWVDVNDRRDVRYPRLPPGEYSFRVIASNSDGVWSTTPESIDFTVERFFYQTTWFVVVCTALVAAAIFGLHRRHVRTMQRRAEELQRANAELERRVQARTADLAAQSATLAERSEQLAKTNETLRASEYFYHSLVESLPQIIVRKDADGRFTYANSAYGELIGRPLEQVIGRTDADLYPAAKAAKYRADDLHVLATGSIMEYEYVAENHGAKRFLHVKKVPLYNQDHQPLGVQVLFWDITAMRETEEKLRAAQQELLETSRLAGMAEVASGVVHNIGNAVNSVNVSATIVAERLMASKLASLKKIAQMLAAQGEKIGEFIAHDPRGQKLPTYLEQLAEVLEKERSDSISEVQALRAGVEHIRQIVAAQESLTRVSAAQELANPAELVEYALRLREPTMSQAGVKVSREFQATPPVLVQKQKVLQILLNLLRNAEDAVADNLTEEKRLKVGVRASTEGVIRISVTDNGVGIPSENLTRIFGFGFTTKKGGHGFGLHSSALMARETGAVLSVRSDGVGHGATFILEIPAQLPGTEKLSPEAAESGDKL